jgi:glycosyltransferase involved in cell wall biosynthesis
MPEFSIIIATIRPTTLASAIESIKRQTFQDWELIVVSQGSSEKIESIVTDFSKNDPRIRYINIPNRGVSRARNAGIKHGTGNFIVFTDDDCEAKEDFLEVLHSFFSMHPEVGLIAGTLAKPQQRITRIGVCPEYYPEEMILTPKNSQSGSDPYFFLVGANFTVRRDIFEKVGLFDEYLGAGTELAAAEDTDIQWRIQSSGIVVASTPRAIVYHTFGFRPGLLAVLRHLRNYHYGKGGFMAKLTLLQDPRGEEWIKKDRREAWGDSLRRPYRIPIILNRLRNTLKAYHYCLKNYSIIQGMLSPKDFSGKLK